ncbi:porin [Massilia sp. X63]|uniref:porin n=1 Tax=Massilia sp. X63 TaxID=3237285 RepID=UPI0034DDB1FC
MKVTQSYSAAAAKIVLTSVALAMPLAASAQGTNVTIYGRLNTGIDNYTAKGAATGAAGEIRSTTRVFDALSRLGFRGVEPLSSDLSAVFQIEGGLNVDNGGNTTQGGQPNTSTGGIATRTTYVGLTSKSMGSLRFGRQDAYWITYPHAHTALSYTHLGPEFLVDAASGLVTIPLARQNNTIQYISPKLGGFSTDINYSGGTESTAAVRDRAYAVKLHYETGPFAVSYDYGRYDNLPAATGPVAGRDKIGQRIAGSYSYATGARIGLLVTRLTNNNVAAVAAIPGGFGGIRAGDNLEVTSVALNWEHTINQFQLFAGYGRTGDVKNSSGLRDTKSSIATLGVRYNLSKRTGVYVDYGQIRNERNNYLDWTIGGISSATGPGGSLSAANAGADPRIFGMGIMHSF